MDLIPRAMVVGLFVPPALPGQPAATPEQINKIWSEVAPGRYTQLQLSPDGAAAQFLGAVPDIGMTIQAPLIQVSDVINLTPAQSGETAQQLLHAVARHLGVTQFFNIGIKLVFHAPLADNDAKGFILNRVISRGGEIVEELLPAGGDVFAGVKVVASHPGGAHTLTVEPLVADQMKSLFIDLDSQFPGPATVDQVKAKVDEAHAYMTTSVSRYLERLLDAH